MRPSLTRLMSSGVLAVATTMSPACGNEEVVPSSSSPPTFDVRFVSSQPASGGALLLARSNNEPVSLSVTFSVSVPEGQGGTYSWNTAIQADVPPISPVVTTAFRPVTLVPGVQTVTITQFHTTNGYCLSSLAARASSSLDIDIRAATSSLAQSGAQFLGKQFNVSFALQCR